jgi:hypothetical protein
MVTENKVLLSIYKWIGIIFISLTIIVCFSLIIYGIWNGLY